jgi:hypothetical protein
VCTIQCKNIDATGVFFIICEFKTTPSFSKEEKKKIVLYSGKYGIYELCIPLHFQASETLDIADLAEHELIGRETDTGKSLPMFVTKLSS